MNLDSNIWGLLAMPVGVAVCFGPVLFLWLKAELTESHPEEDLPPDRKKRVTPESDQRKRTV